MEQNNNKKKSISDELDDLLNELSWKQLKKVIDDNSAVTKAVSIGGVRILSKNRKIIIPTVKRKCFDTEMILYNIFTVWFNEKKTYYECLVSFFDSDEHRNILEKRGIDSFKYALNDAYFVKFVDILKVEDIYKFLFLSPVCFTPTQEKELKELSHTHNATEKKTQQGAKSETKSSKNTEGIFLTKGEWKHAKKELKKCQKDMNKLEKKVDRLNIRQKNHNMEKATLNQEIKEIEISHKNEKDKLINRHNTLLKKNSDLETKFKKTNSRLKEKNNQINNLERITRQMQEEKENYFHQILSKLDTETIMSELNASDDVLELLDTVIRPPKTDSSKGAAQTLLTLKDFWKDLMLREKEVVDNLLEISAKEVADFEYFHDWADIADDFNDLKCSLSARIYLSNIFYNILQEYYIQEV